MRRKIPESTLPKVKRILMITPEGMQKLRDEHDQLWRIERKEVTAKVAWAASLGDRSENADYHYNKKRLREIDSRIRYLCKCVDNLKVVEYHPSQEGTVMFGAWVDVSNDRGMRRKLRIVGFEELKGNKDYISVDSPIGQALLKLKVGDSTKVQTPVGEMVWTVNGIEYEK
jgi:transcription elongation factor GreB